MFKTVILAGAALALSAGVALTADMVQINTEAEFRKVIADKKLDWKTGYVMFHSDGSISGTWKGKKLAGTWNWVGNTYCRTMTADGGNAQYDCRTVVVKGNTATITRKAGKGKPYDVTIMEK